MECGETMTEDDKLVVLIVGQMLAPSFFESCLSGPYTNSQFKRFVDLDNCDIDAAADYARRIVARIKATAPIVDPV